MNINKHNPNYKLVSKLVYLDGKWINLVYGIDNNGNNEGLELFFYKTRNLSENFYRSYRYETKKIPKKYISHFENLKKEVVKVPNGHKLTLN